jgi:hypothetical protein
LRKNGLGYLWAIYSQTHLVTLFQAKTGVDTFLKQLEKNSKLEFVSLIGFSSQCDLLCPFTRDFQARLGST